MSAYLTSSMLRLAGILQACADPQVIASAVAIVALASCLRIAFSNLTKSGYCTCGEQILTMRTGKVWQAAGNVRFPAWRQSPVVAPSSPSVARPRRSPSSAFIYLKRWRAGYTLWISHGGLMNRTTLFQSNRSQAVRLPKDVAFPEGVRSVAILREGKRRVIVPSDAVWDDFFDAPGVDLGDRNQPEVQGREEF